MSFIIIRQIIIWVLVWFSLAFVGACHAIRFQGSLQVITRSTCATGFCPVEYYDTMQGKVIRLVTIGDTSCTPVLLLHGSPSSLMEWMPIMQDTSFVKHYYILAIDRPGYGLAGYGNLEMDLHAQANMVQHILNRSHINKPACIVGSSYGGSLAACYAMDYPRHTRSLVLMYASVKPGAEKIYPISNAVRWPVIEQLTPTLLRMPTYEKFNHYRLLQTLNKWDSISCPTLIIHGTADSLIYYENALYAQHALRNAKVTLQALTGYRHAIMFSKPELMKHILKEYLGSI